MDFLINSELLDLGSAKFIDYIVDFGVLLALLLLLKVITTHLMDISSMKTLTEDDNQAAGISFAGILFSMAIILSGVSADDPAYSIMGEIILMSGYGVLGIVLIFLTKIIHDLYMLTSIDLSGSIKRGNISAAIASTGNLIATALIIRALMMWVDADTLVGLIGVAMGYVIVQIVLLVSTKMRNKSISGDKTIESEIKEGNVGIALQYAGHRIGIAFAMAASTGISVYMGDTLIDIAISVITWIIITFIFIMIQAILSKILHATILHKMNTEHEIIEDNNGAIGMVSGTLYIVAGLVMYGLFG